MTILLHYFCILATIYYSLLGWQLRELEMLGVQAGGILRVMREFGIGNLEVESTLLLGYQQEY